MKNNNFKSIVNILNTIYPNKIFSKHLNFKQTQNLINQETSNIFYINNFKKINKTTKEQER